MITIVRKFKAQQLEKSYYIINHNNFHADRLPLYFMSYMYMPISIFVYINNRIYLEEYIE